MKDRTVDHSRPDAGEADKDIKTKGTDSKAYEHNENFRVRELAAKIAQVLGERSPPEDEYRRRQRVVRKLVGAIAGTGYGAVGGGLIGGRTGSGYSFDDKRALIGALMGALGGGALGYGAGTAANKVVEYTGGDRQQPHIQIVLPPTESVAQRVEDAMKTASAKTNYIYGFVKRALAQQPYPVGLTKQASPAAFGAVTKALVPAGTKALVHVPRPPVGFWQRMMNALRRTTGGYVTGVGTSLRPLSRTAGRGLQDLGMQISPMQYRGAYLAGRATPYVGAIGATSYGLNQLRD